ncbi:MAG: hypothetical protein R3A13_09255 [Bdellovibrionota bacterium]
MSAKLTKSILLLSILFLSLPGQLLAEEIDALLKRFNEFVAQENYPKALEELAWVRKEIETKSNDKVKSFFTDELGGLKGQELQANSAMGFTSIERKYSGPNKSITVSLAGGSSGGNNPFGGIAALGQMAAMMGGQQGGDSFRINGRTASFQSKGNSGELSVFLDSGSILKFENADKDTLKTMAEEFNIEGLDKYLKGNA